MSKKFDAHITLTIEADNIHEATRRLNMYIEDMHLVTARHISVNHSPEYDPIPAQPSGPSI